MTFTESGFLEMLAERSRKTPLPAGVELGIGDDAACLAGGAGAFVVTTDMLLDGVDFRLAECGWRRAARKAVCKNLSDLAAMGTDPWGLFAAVALPPTGAAEAAELIEGLAGEAESRGCPLLGGDTKRSPGPLVLSLTALGRVVGRGPILRSGARPGDLLFVSGRLGGSSLGRHLDFEPRTALGTALARHGLARAMIDLSDGLSSDLNHLCRASGTGAVIDAGRLPLAQAAHALAARDGRPALDHALHDGEDYELLFAAPAEREPEVLALQHGVEITRIGRMVEAGQGVTLEESGKPRPLLAGGFQHRFDGGPP